MKIFYRPETGRIIERVTDANILLYDTSRLSSGYEEYVIDEVLENAGLVGDIITAGMKQGKTNTEENVGKYYIDSGELYQREGWEEYHDEY